MTIDDLKTLEGYFGGRPELLTVLGISDRRYREWRQSLEGRERKNGTIRPIGKQSKQFAETLLRMIRANNFDVKALTSSTRGSRGT